MSPNCLTWWFGEIVVKTFDYLNSLNGIDSAKGVAVPL
jgi:hypothetical protein